MTTKQDRHQARGGKKPPHKRKLSRGNAVTVADVRELFEVDDLDLDTLSLDGLSAKELGYMGEYVAAALLVDQGLEIIEHGYRCPEGEADLIAYDADSEEVVLVEVKTRRMRRLDDDLFPEDAVDYAKQARYRRIAGCYLMDHFPIPSMRFDVVSVSVVSGFIGGVTCYKGAFDWDADR